LNPTLWLRQPILTPIFNQYQPGYRPGDVVFVIEGSGKPDLPFLPSTFESLVSYQLVISSPEKNEQGRLFQRIGASNDLIYTHYITLHEALAGTVFPVIHMDNRVLLVRPHECGSPGTIKTGDVVLIKVNMFFHVSILLSY